MSAMEEETLDLASEQDNKNAVSIINKGSKVQELQHLSLEIYRCCLLENITLHIIWLPSKENEQADLLSRIIDIDDWGISPEYFQFLDDLLGPHTFDRFANMDNYKVDKFSSLYWNPGSSAVDAFSCHWALENNLLVPPVSLIYFTYWRFSIQRCWLTEAD
ncbi:uncharacterized protein [Mytilus edulis]|uniref:uncharacterized protein n=1 Tax=Mytilus edulis TaxID=6550 RepID=UPI0039EEC278